MTAGAMKNDQEWTVRQILDWTINYLKDSGSETPRLDAEILLSHARQCRRIQLYVQYDQPLTPQQRSVMRELVKRRAAAEPVAYLVGHREFFSLDFHVQAGVLIPRPDTEILVMSALDRLRELPRSRMLDLCTGTGCVPIAVAKNHAGVQLAAVEISSDAAEVARRNIARYQLESRVRLWTGDLFDTVPAGEQFQVITANAPYIPSAEIDELAADVRNHEPRQALDGGPDGLDIIRRIVTESPRFLHPQGWLLLEISPEQAEAVTGLLAEEGFEQVAVRNDLAGQARVASGQWNR